jgi:hypothetical protein
MTTGRTVGAGDGDLLMEQRDVVVARDCRRLAHIAVRLVSVAELRGIMRTGELTAVDAAYLALDHAGLLR